MTSHILHFKLPYHTHVNRNRKVCRRRNYPTSAILSQCCLETVGIIKGFEIESLLKAMVLYLLTCLFSIFTVIGLRLDFVGTYEWVGRMNRKLVGSGTDSNVISQSN